jgi:hypothetical protein
MREIVRLTGQKQPLQVGVPLYPFSHHTLFKKDGGTSLRESPTETAGGQAPLLVSPSFDGRPSSSGQTPLVNNNNNNNGMTTWPTGNLTPPNGPAMLGVESDMRSTSSFSK